MVFRLLRTCTDLVYRCCNLVKCTIMGRDTRKVHGEKLELDSSQQSLHDYVLKLIQLVLIHVLEFFYDISKFFELGILLQVLDISI